jgi:tetratricopeptide (TPR) repeat protein
MEEQLIINEVYSKLRSGQTFKKDELEKIESRFASSVVLQYYLGVYYEKTFDLDKAEQQFSKCLKLCPLFVPPYFNLAIYYISLGRFSEAEKRLNFIFLRKTIDPTSHNKRLRIDLVDNFRICSLLSPEYLRQNEKSKTLELYQRLIRYVKKELSPCLQDNYFLLEGWKNVCLGAGNLLMETSPEDALQMYYDGLTFFKLKPGLRLTMEQTEVLHSLEKHLVTAYKITSSYALNPPSLPIDINTLYAHQNAVVIQDITGRKVRLGYISPDFNKNAVGLFVTALLKHFNPNKFEVFCYYNCQDSDEYTELLMSYPGVTWTNVSHRPIAEVRHLMSSVHQLDILVDLIAGGANHCLDLIATAPAPIIINYLGYPDTVGLKEFTHRIVDAWTDPPNKASDGESLIRMPRCFLCYTLFENVRLPPIRHQSLHGLIRVGIFNKTTKHHPVVRKVWKMVLEKNKQVVLCLKLGQGQTEASVRNHFYSGFPQKQLRFLPFTEKLEEYLDQFNDVDICADTFPYNGTTTTCSSLVMGVPVFTVYHPEINPHVSNVSGSLMLNTSLELEKYLSRTVEEYGRKLLAWTRNPAQIDRQHLRQLFLQAMHPVEFMKDYENLLSSLLK